MRVTKRSLTNQELKQIANELFRVDRKIGNTPREIYKDLQKAEMTTCVENFETNEPLFAFIGDVRTSLEHLPNPRNEKIKFIFYWSEGRYWHFPLSY